MNTHTFGPWHLGKRAGNPAIYSQDGAEIAEVLHVTNDDWQGNARLLAAAPDLLKAVQAMVDAFGDQDSILIDQCKAALSKAEGREA